MKIIIFGATGDVGRQVVREARGRGHHVTAVGRSTTKLAELPDGVATVIADIGSDENAITDMVSAQDLVISALRPDLGQEAALVGLTRSVLRAATTARTPIIVTGGAATLKLADNSGHTVLSAPGFLPAAVRPIAEACAAQDALLDKADGVDWVCLRPPATLLHGPRTGNYVLGTDTLVTDPAGVSQISYADFAAAMLDIAEGAGEAACRLTVGWGSTQSNPDEPAELAVAS